jgi:ABC-type dipeptide/oligopeptide/nickel transport system permease component
MLSFASRRIASIILVSIVIVFAVQLGMGLVSNSRNSRPNYDLVNQGLNAWEETRAFLSGREWRLEGAELWVAYRNSMGLLGVALAGSAVLALGIGVAAALARGGRWALPLLGLTILGVSTPSFVAALLLWVAELTYLDIFGRRLVSMAGFGWDFEHMFLPVLVLAARPLAYLTRAAYLGLSRVMREDFVRTAHAKGLGMRRTVGVHALKNVAVPMLTALGVSLRFSLSTLPVVELFFQWPGAGIRFLNAIGRRDTGMVVSLALAFGVSFLVINLLLDILYRLIDPRIREA